MPFAGELGVAVPPGTSPHLVASALKFYLARLRHPLLEVTQLDSIAALAGILCLVFLFVFGTKVALTRQKAQ